MLLGLLGGIAGCAMPREITKTPRSAIEQLLLGEALTRSLFDLALPVPHEDPLFMEVTGLSLGLLVSSGLNNPSGTIGAIAPSMDLIFIKDVIGSQLGSMGHRVVKNEQDARYLIQVVVESFGTNQSSSFFGLPAIQSVIIPFSLPQLALYQNLSQVGFIRYSLNVIERATGRTSFSTPWYQHTTFHDQYT